MTDFVIEKVICVYGGPFKKRVIIPSEHIKEESGKTYAHLSTALHHMSALLVSQNGRIKRRERPLARTDVIQQLIALRNEKIAEQLDSTGGVEQLSLFDDKPKDKRIKIEHKVDMPSSATIQAPSIGETPGIDINVLLSWKKTAPLYCEFTVHSACAFLFEGCVPVAAGE